MLRASSFIPCLFPSVLPSSFQSCHISTASSFHRLICPSLRPSRLESFQASVHPSIHPSTLPSTHPPKSVSLLPNSFVVCMQGAFLEIATPNLRPLLPVRSSQPIPPPPTPCPVRFNSFDCGMDDLDKVVHACVCFCLP